MAIEDTLAQIGRMTAPLSDDNRAELRRLLRDKRSLVVTRAARAMGRSGEAGFREELAAAFARLLALPGSADPVCRAKEEIVEALEALGHPDAAPFVTGARYQQWEPVYGGRADTAVGLRAKCAETLARLNATETPFVLTDLLADDAPTPREAAAKGIAYWSGESAELLLRLRVRTGETHPNVLRACFAGLITLDPDRGVAFAAEHLSADTEVAEVAALALGESRADAAWEALRRAWDDLTNFELASTLLLAIALTRRDDAFDHLLGILRDGAKRHALQAAESLALYAHDDRRRAGINDALAARGDEGVREAFLRAVG